jgi:serine/threonine-protein kinase
VFLAERSDNTYEQSAALKVMAAQLIGSDAIARFKAERQILANLDHPYIAKLVDGGSTDDGVPYLVMDYINGLPIDRHCQDHRLDIDARLDLFSKVCDAVDYAHRNLIVHRDLKPSNILVDSNGNPRLLDFGIAKLLGADALRGDPALTQVGARILTPEYASPEQVRGEPVTVATDVYSLGVVLYWLMTGQSPYGATHKTPRDVEQAVVDHTPARPSTVVSSPATWTTLRLKPCIKTRRAATRRPQRWPPTCVATDATNRCMRAATPGPTWRASSSRAMRDAWH